MLISRSMCQCFINGKLKWRESKTLSRKLFIIGEVNLAMLEIEISGYVRISQREIA